MNRSEELDPFPDHPQTNIHQQQPTNRRQPTNRQSTEKQQKHDSTWEPRIRLLDGPIDVVYSLAQTFPRLHIDDACRAFETVPETSRHQITFVDVYQLGLAESARPCRVCALESVLYTVLHDDTQTGIPNAVANAGVNDTRFGCHELVFFTTSPQPCPVRQDSSLARFKWTDSTDSARERVLRLGARCNLEVCHSVIGPVLYGTRTRRSAQVVRMNLRTSIAPTATVENPEVTVSTLWTLLNDNPPELVDEFADATALWQTATMLSR